MKAQIIQDSLTSEEACVIPEEALPMTGTIDTLTVTTHWFPQCQFAGLYMAKAKGFYKEAGLEIIINYSDATVINVSNLTSGNSDIITTFLTEALIARDSGVPIINILQTSYRSAIVIVSQEPLNGVADLNHKRVGKWLNSFSETAIGFATTHRLDITWIPFSSDVNIFFSGAMDATLAMDYNEYFQIKMSGMDIDSSQVIRLADVGFNIPEDGLYTTESTYAKKSDAIKRFVAATRKGWEWVQMEENFNETVDHVMRLLKSENIASSRIVQEHMLRAVINNQKNEEGKAEFFLSKRQYDAAAKMLSELSFITTPVDYNTFVKTF